MRLRDVSISLYVFVLGTHCTARVVMTVQWTTSGKLSFSRMYTIAPRWFLVELEVSRHSLNAC
ncbi:hypothetical protein CC86DRAFT_369876 [Ophiobolus disseminans]|uniref:Uncharacterized protein n=1 Tax=Ophiobolus disseminans TaxID=1469910 RepID=A0A6A7A033_9PLEO|nr:hypothetical protein CC86DRAFT_369876 [Ophiobolus disseminans]